MEKELWVDHISFSQLSTVESCPYNYYLLKIAGIEPVPNAFAQAGTLAHQLLAMWAKGEAKATDLPLLWVNRFPKEVTAPFPRYLESKGYAGKLFDSVLTYFESFDGFPGYEVIGAEKEFSSSIAGQPFVGIIDLILQNKETGKLTLVDHKSSSLSSFRKNKEGMYRQLLLYSKYCADMFGSFPAKLRFNLYKEHTYDERDFDAEDFMAARIWAENQIREMMEKDITDWFETQPELFRCTNLCDCRNECLYGRPENHRRKDEAHENNHPFACSSSCRTAVAHNSACTELFCCSGSRLCICSDRTRKNCWAFHHHDKRMPIAQTDLEKPIRCKRLSDLPQYHWQERIFQKDSHRSRQNCLCG